MKLEAFILVAAAVATLGIAACEREEEPTGSPSVTEDTIPTTDTIPVVDTLPASPWYHSLVGTRWYCHDDFEIPQVHIHEIDDIYWDFVDDSTIRTTFYGIEYNGVPMLDTTISSCRYRYYPDELKCTTYDSWGDASDYYLDTVQKTLTLDRPSEFVPSQQVFHLTED